MKHFVVVGGTKGIGLEVVKMLSQSSLVLVYARTKPDIEFNENVTFVPFDVTSAEEFGQIPESVDGLVYCPGSINLKPFHRLTPQDFQNDYSINVLGAIKAIQAFLPSLKKGVNPSIVLFSTVAVAVGMPFHASIAAAKGAVEGLTKSLAAEFAPVIRVNVIAPSLTKTSLAEKLVNSPEKIEAGGKRHPLGRIGTAEELASAALYLLGDQSTWMTGQILHLDGGMSSVKLG